MDGNVYKSLLNGKDMTYDFVICSGYFNPLHKGHVEYLQLARKLGKELWVIMNNDEQVKIKGSKPFMDLDERCVIVKELKSVDNIFISVDTDPSVCESIKELGKKLGGTKCFAKGGDRFVNEIPEAKICMELGIDIVDGLGKKIQNSSDLLKDY